MIGLAIALICGAWSLVVNNATVAAAVVGTLPFLWWWHVGWACVAALVIGLVFLVSTGCLFAKDSALKAGGLAGMFIASPLIAIMTAISSALFLGGVYCADVATRCADTGAALPTEEWNMPVFICGCIMYGLACLRQLSTKISASSSSSS